MPDEIKTSNVTRRQLFRWLAWFALANAIVLGLISLRYLDGGIGGLTPVAWVYLFSIYVSHHSWLALLPLFVVLTPVILLKPSFGWTRAMAVTVMAALIAVIMLDSLLWSQSRFHINMLTLKILGSSSFIFVVVMFFIALLFETLLSSRVWAWVSNSPSRGGRLLGWVLAVCFLVAQAIYAWADASYYVPVTSVAQQLPVQRGFTAKGLLVRFGLVDISQSRERQLASRVAGTQGRSEFASLNYPLKPLQCSLQQPLNLLIILVDALRGDMLQRGVTPHIDAFAKRRASRFTQHFSGGNSSRIGVFSLFYGLPPGYFRSFEAVQRPPVLMRQLVSSGYQLGVYSSANLYRPVTLDRTAFAEVANLRVETKPTYAPAWRRDQIVNDEWMAWLESRSADQPFFGFIFYDAVNVSAFPPDMDGQVIAGSGEGMAQAFAKYQTSIRFVDSLVGDVIDDLEKRGLADSTVIIISSDHGEEFNENGDGVKGHGSGYGPYQLHVPLLVAWPGMPPGQFDHRTSHFDIAPTLMSRLLGCDNDPSDYASGRDLYAGESWDWLIAGSYYNYAVLEPQQITVTFPNGTFEVRDENYRLKPDPQFNADVLEAVMKENVRFHQ